MIVKMEQGDIFKKRSGNHIFFAVNKEGFNDAGFAGLVSRNYWPELANTGGNELGDCLYFHYHKDENDLTGIHFHACVCHSLKDGWKAAPAYINEALKKLPDELISCVLMGNGFIGKMQGANVDAIKSTLQLSNHKVEVFYL